MCWSCVLIARLSRWGRDWQDDVKLSAAARTRVDDDLAAVHLDRPLGDREPKAGAAMISGACFINAKETIEDALTERRWDAGPFVGDRH